MDERLQRPICGGFCAVQFHHQAVYALLQLYVFPDECLDAGVEAITAILKAHCCTAFDRQHAERLIARCRDTLSRPIRREEIRQRVHHLIDDITTWGSDIDSDETTMAVG